MGKGKQKKRRIGRPSRLLWGLAMLFLIPWYRLRYRVKIDRSGLEGLQGPALVLAPHISGKDHILVGITLRRYRPTFVLSEHFMAHPVLRWFLRRLHVITKKMFCADTRTIMDILRAKGEGNVTVLFPEGRLPACGHSLPVAEGTAELVKKLGVDVYTVTGNGAYLTFPKWGLRRRGRIRVTTAKLFDGAALAAMPLDEVREKIAAAISHDDESAMEGVRYRVSDTTAGLDGLLRRCPLCGAVGTLVTGGGHIRCGCGLDATLDEYYLLHGAPFKRLNDWFDWQQSRTDPAMEVLENDVTVGAVDGKGNLRADAGQGRVRLDCHTFTFRGEVFGEPVSFTLPTEKIGGLPVTVAKHFDVYCANRMYHFYPVPDGRSAMDYVMFLDRYHTLRRAGELPAPDGKREEEMP